MALNSLLCADVLLRNCSLTQSKTSSLGIVQGVCTATVMPCPVGRVNAPENVECCQCCRQAPGLIKGLCPNFNALAGKIDRSALVGSESATDGSELATNGFDRLPTNGSEMATNGSDRLLSDAKIAGLDDSAACVQTLGAMTPEPVSISLDNILQAQAVDNSCKPVIELLKANVSRHMLIFAIILRRHRYFCPNGIC